MGKKVLFFDVDGTLINEQKEIPPSALAAIEEARRQGHLVFINSGRTAGLLKQLTERIAVDGLVCGCGTEILADGARLYYYKLPEQVKNAVKQYAFQYNVDAVLEGTKGCYFRPQHSRFPEIERTKYLVGLEDGIGPEPYDAGYEVSKFCIQADEQSDIEGFKREFGQWFDIIDRGAGFYECVPLGHSKGTAILKVLGYYGIPLEDAYVFGDSTNDIGMFKVCKNCIAMGKHDAELRPYASYITTDVDDDGVANALRHFGIIA